VYACVRDREKERDSVHVCVSDPPSIFVSRSKKSDSSFRNSSATPAGNAYVYMYTYVYVSKKSPVGPMC